MSRSLRRWHRWTGILSAAIMLIVAVTGILLNHADDLALDERLIHNRAVVAFYGLDAQPTAEYVESASHLLVRHDGVLYLDGRPVVDLDEPLVGAMAAPVGVIAATAGRLLLIDDEARLIESLSGSLGLPLPVEALGTTAAGDPAFRASRRTYLLDPETLNWTATDAELAVRGTATAGLPPDFSDVASPAVSLEHVLLDLHTGRVLGRPGPWVADLAALGLCLLAASGIAMAIALWRR